MAQDTQEISIEKISFKSILSIKEFCAFYSVSRETLDQYRIEGIRGIRLPFSQAGKRVFISRKKADEFFDKLEVNVAI